MVCGRGFGLAWVVGHQSIGFVCVMGFGSPIWFWFLWVLVRRDGFAGGFRSRLRFRSGLLGWWVLAAVLWRFCGGFWLRFVPWVFFFIFLFFYFGGWGLRLWLVVVAVAVVVDSGGSGCWQRVLAVAVGLLVMKEM